jgi:hypothetical protein
MFLSETRIQDQNAINATANEVEGHLLRLLSPWQGLKIRKISGGGGNVAKLQAEFDRYCQDHGYNQPDQPWHLCLTGTYTSLVATLRMRCSARPMVEELYVARFNDGTGIMTHLSEGHQRRTDYTLAEVEQGLANAEQLENQARALRSTFRLFISR